MSYSALINDSGNSSEFLIVLTPRRIPTGWILISGAKYSASFTYGYVSSFEWQGIALQLASNSSLSDGAWFYDHEASTLYVDNSSDPSFSFVVVGYELYFGTKPANWNRKPLDQTSQIVHFDGCVIQAPTVKTTLSDLLFGVIPLQSSSLQISNDLHELERHLYDSSFKNSTCEIYHWVKKLTAANIQLFTKMFSVGVSYRNQTVTFSLADQFSFFDSDFRGNPGAPSSFANASIVPNSVGVDPNFVGKSIRTVYGRVDGFVPINVSYQPTSPTTSDNRSWRVGNQFSSLANYDVISVNSFFVLSNTTTRTYVTSVGTVAVGDRLTLPRGTPEYPLVTGVNKISNYIDHTAITSAMTSLETFKFSPYIKRVYILQNDVSYEAFYIRDFTHPLIGITTNHDSGLIKFNTSLEANTGMPATLSPSDTVYVTVEVQPSVTVAATPLGASTGNLIATLASVLKNEAGLTDSDLDTASFIALDGSVPDIVGFAIPQGSQDGIPQIRSVLADLLRTGLLRLFLNSNNKWSVAQVKPFTSPVQTVDSSELTESSFIVEYGYQDMASDIAVAYNYREVSDVAGLQNGVVSTVTASNPTTRFLHKINLQKTLQSLHRFQADATTLANRLSYIFGERIAKVAISAKSKLTLNAVSDQVELQLEKMPGNAYVPGTIRTQELSIIEVNRDLASVSIVSDDQKGIQDNSGSW